MLYNLLVASVLLAGAGGLYPIHADSPFPCSRHAIESYLYWIAGYVLVTVTATKNMPFWAILAFSVLIAFVCICTSLLYRRLFAMLFPRAFR